MRLVAASINRVTSSWLSTLGVLAEHAWQGARLLGKRQIVESQIAPLQSLLVKKPQSRDVELPNLPQTPCCRHFVMQPDFLSM
jgi:hypothetical protein